ncbi:MAG: type II toxin-antitoxin system Phd/YefM family antitoxin [Gammaproteobacteria bacterium]|nr:type II toxin-antitoxin system Phd/YefM family antitoxin [Gammaproteobacteria bacterium]
MITINVNEARTRLDNLIDEASKTHKPILIVGIRNNVVLLAEEDWKTINETLYLVSTPGMRESIIEGMETSLEECDKALDW